MLLSDCNLNVKCVFQLYFTSTNTICICSVESFAILSVLQDIPELFKHPTAYTTVLFVDIGSI